jgi:hypothetical protein
MLLRIRTMFGEAPKRQRTFASALFVLSISLTPTERLESNCGTAEWSCVREGPQKLSGAFLLKDSAGT